MADLSGTTGPSHEAEDISTFLHHFLHSTSTLMSPSEDFHRFGNRPDSSSGINFTDPGVHFPADVKESAENTFFSDGNASPRRRGFSAENDLGELSCDSENLNPAPLSRTTSKRTRAAEVHNLSEKRRRSRINEKMKALQNLIPNSNKTDKASMLDEAIEYLKQLQLQVQMLSMRNGISLHPMCVPGVLHPLQLSQLGLDFDEGNGMPNSNREAGPFSANQESSRRSAFDSSDQNTPNLQNATPSVTNITNSETPFGFEQPEYEPFNLPTSSKEICKEVALPELQFDMSGSGKKSSSGVS